MAAKRAEERVHGSGMEQLNGRETAAKVPDEKQSEVEAKMGQGVRQVVG